MNRISKIKNMASDDCLVPRFVDELGDYIGGRGDVDADKIDRKCDEIAASIVGVDTKVDRLTSASEDIKGHCYDMMTMLVGMKTRVDRVEKTNEDIKEQCSGMSKALTGMETKMGLIVTNDVIIDAILTSMSNKIVDNSNDTKESLRFMTIAVCNVSDRICGVINHISLACVIILFLYFFACVSESVASLQFNADP